MAEDVWLGDDIAGRWWIPGDPDSVVGGVIERREHSFKLHLLGWLGEWTERRHAGNPAERARCPEVLHGTVAGRPVTLLGCLLLGLTGPMDGSPHEANVHID